MPEKNDAPAESTEGYVNGYPAGVAAAMAREAEEAKAAAKAAK